MENPDEDPEWSELVHQAERAKFKCHQRDKRSFWLMILGQIWVTGWQIIVGVFLVTMTIATIFGMLADYLGALSSL